MVKMISPFLAFTGQARTALSHYLKVFPAARCTTRVLYGPGEEAPEGMVRLAVLNINQATLRLIDVGERDGFDQTMGMSVFVECDTSAEVDALAAPLADGGAVLMPLDAYPFAARFTWLQDRFGVNWQLVSKPLLET